jgi:hypothetical protein
MVHRRTVVKPFDHTIPGEDLFFWIALSSCAFGLAEFGFGALVRGRGPHRRWLRRWQPCVSPLSDQGWGKDFRPLDARSATAIRSRLKVRSDECHPSDFDPAITDRSRLNKIYTIVLESNGWDLRIPIRAALF